MGAIYKIGSFNTCNLSLNVNRDMERIARIIRENDLDIVALQEVLSEGKRIVGLPDSRNEALRKGMFERSLMRCLGPHWDCRVGKPGSGGDRRGESCAFLWNKRRVELADNGGKIKGIQEWDGYHLREPGLTRLVRDPLVGRFVLKGRRVELRLITTHIVFGKPNDLDLRRSEFKVLAGDIYANVSDLHKDIAGVVPYTIILGDYNMNLPQSGVDKNQLPEVMYFDKRGRSTLDPAKTDRIIHTVQHDLTTLQKVDGHARDGYANNYDHFSFEERVKRDVFRGCCAVDAVHGTTARMSPRSYMMATQQPSGPDSPFEIYLQNVSDHLPVVIELDL